MVKAHTVYVYRWGKYRPELKGLRCTVLARGAMNTALVQFETGERAIVIRNALRKLKPGEPAQKEITNERPQRD